MVLTKTAISYGYPFYVKSRCELIKQLLVQRQENNVEKKFSNTLGDRLY